MRRGLEQGLSGRRIATVRVLHPRACRDPARGADLAGDLPGRTVLSARRTGKYLWLPLDGDLVLVAHLGMSGQLLVVPPESPDPVHLRVRVRFADGGRELRFVDQRTFGSLRTEPYSGTGPPAGLAHIAADPLDPAVDAGWLTRALRARDTGLKRALLDQRLVSGVGNIYADEALWRARLHYAQPTRTMTTPRTARLLAGLREVLEEALAAGGTSFDKLYVSTDGVSGLFDRSLAVYGRAGRACPRCGAPIRRERFMNRSSFSCPSCQPRPRRPHW